MRFFERLVDPFAEADGPPPERLGPFARWLMRGTEPVIYLFIAVSMLLGIAEAVAAWLLGWAVDLAALGDPETVIAENWPGLLGAALFFLLARPLLMRLSSGFSSRAVGPGLFLLGAMRLHRHTLGQSMSYFEDDFAGRIAQKETQTGLAISEAVNESVNALAYGLATIVASVVVLTGADWRLGLLLAVWFGAYLWLTAHFLPRIRALSRRKAETRAGITGQLVDSIAHMGTVKLFAHAGREEVAAETSMQRHWEAAMAFGRTIWLFRTLHGLLAGILPAAMLALAFWLWAVGSEGPGILALAGLLSTRLAQMSGWISFTAMGIFANVGVVEDGMKTLSPPHDIVDEPDAREPPPANGAIAFEDVRFRYQDDSPGGLHGIDLAIRPGEKVALVGPSGAGKSTVVKLLLRLHDVDEGRITLDGRDIRGLTQDGLRRQIATVTQDPAMFNRSALDNILYGRPEAGREAAVAAAKAAGAHDFIGDLKDRRGRRGYEAHLGEDGVKLSGGQRQRVALARAILKDAPVLVLDEATSALDSETEAEIQKALERVMRGKTVLAIAHRLSTIQSMDRILVMEAGRLVEEGSHEALLARGGLYARLWQRQSGGFLTDSAA